MVVDHLVSREKKHLENKTACCKQTFDYRTLCQCFSLTFFPPCFSTMSVLSGKWSSWGVLEPPPLGIVQLSPRQASFTLPLHRHQPSGTKGEKKKTVGEVSNWPLHFFENIYTLPDNAAISGTSSTLFSTIIPLFYRKSGLWGRTAGWVAAAAGKKLSCSPGWTRRSS